MILQTENSDWVSSWLISGLLKDMLDQGGFISVGSWQIPVFGLIGLIIAGVLFWIVYRVITKMIDRLLKRRGFSPNLLNGVKFIVRLLIMILFLSMSLALLNVSTDYILIIGSIITTAIAFASMKSITNFVAGIWLNITRPIGIGDYVEVAGVEGIVTEISLNYIRIKEGNGNFSQIPNINCIQSKITNYTLSIKEFEDKIEKAELNLQAMKKNQPNLVGCNNENVEYLKARLQEMKEVQSCLDKKGACIDKEHSIYVHKGKIVRYTFTVELKREYRKNAEVLTKICKKWKDIFEIEPKWELGNLQTFFVYRIVIYTPDPEDLVRYYDDFINDIYMELY